MSKDNKVRTKMWLRIKATGQEIEIIVPAVAEAMVRGGTAEKIEPRQRKVETASIRPPQSVTRSRAEARVALEV